MKPAVTRAEPRLSVCALLTCFNRRDKTLACLRALAASRDVEQVVLRAVLVDDGSTDGTAQAVREAFPWVEVVRGDGSLFWCRGMHRAFETAQHTGFDHYLWLNDDTMLLPDALARLLACEVLLRQQRADAPVIVIGSTIDPVSGAHTYGGERHPSRLGPFRVERVAPALEAQRCDTLTGNIVLIPANAAQRVGNLDPIFEHAMGDTDYGLRARALGIELWAAPQVHGTCAHNPVAGTYLDESLPLATRWQRMLHRKGLPWRSWLTFTRRHMGLLWPLFFAWPYAKLWVGAPFAASRRRGSAR
jgi:GT2 family glycosyltransferase